MQLAKHISDYIEGERVEITDKLPFFSLRSFAADKTEKNMSFLKELFEHAAPDLRLDHDGSAVYFFKTGGTCGVSLHIECGEQIEVTPHVIYDKTSISKEIESLVFLERLIFATLQKNGLQGGA